VETGDFIPGRVAFLTATAPSSGFPENRRRFTVFGVQLYVFYTSRGASKRPSSGRAGNTRKPFKSNGLHRLGTTDFLPQNGRFLT
jgi:hypothetical protein